MSRVYLILYQELMDCGLKSDHVTEHGAAVGASTVADAISALNRGYAATIIQLRIRSVVEWQPELSTKVIGLNS